MTVFSSDLFFFSYFVHLDISNDTTCSVQASNCGKVPSRAGFVSALLPSSGQWEAAAFPENVLD